MSQFYYVYLYQLTKGIYSRDQCFKTKQGIVKDLTVITKDFKRIVLIDVFYWSEWYDVYESSAYEWNTIKSYKGTKDRELIKYAKQLSSLSGCDDMLSAISNNSRRYEVSDGIEQAISMKKEKDNMQIKSAVMRLGGIDYVGFTNELQSCEENAIKMEAKDSSTIIQSGSLSMACNLSK